MVRLEGVGGGGGARYVDGGGGEEGALDGDCAAGGGLLDAGCVEGSEDWGVSISIVFSMSWHCWLEGFVLGYEISYGGGMHTVIQVILSALL